MAMVNNNKISSEIKVGRMLHGNPSVGYHSQGVRPLFEPNMKLIQLMPASQRPDCYIIALRAIDEFKTEIDDFVFKAQPDERRK